MYLIGESREHPGQIVAYMTVIAGGVRLYAETNLCDDYLSIMDTLHADIIKQAIDAGIDIIDLQFLVEE